MGNNAAASKRMMGAPRTKESNRGYRAGPPIRQAGGSLPSVVPCKDLYSNKLETVETLQR